MLVFQEILHKFSKDMRKFFKVKQKARPHTVYGRTETYAIEQRLRGTLPKKLFLTESNQFLIYSYLFMLVILLF